jgi:hypothetical protein
MECLQKRSASSFRCSRARQALRQHDYTISDNRITAPVSPPKLASGVSTGIAWPVRKIYFFNLSLKTFLNFSTFGATTNWQ